MNMKLIPSLLKCSLALGAVLLTAPVAQTQDSKSRETPRSESSMMSSMQGMMDQCAKHCENATQRSDAMMSRLREVRDSNDPAKMRAAIDDALKMSEEVKGTMAQCTKGTREACMHMMDMMGRMHGGMMKHQDRDATKATDNPNRP